jgi:methylated-DNA-[protein]-cysteine S-methyltransferase
VDVDLNAQPRGPVPPALRPAAAALESYLRSGTLKPGVPLNLSGTSEFARTVYEELRGVAPGDAISYGELANRIGRPRAARAVGAALGRNPLLIFVPCHRVVRADGRMGGFGAGPEWKTGLLQHEGWHIREGRITRHD